MGCHTYLMVTDLQIETMTYHLVGFVWTLALLGWAAHFLVKGLRDGHYRGRRRHAGRG